MKTSNKKTRFFRPVALLGAAALIPAILLLVPDTSSTLETDAQTTSPNASASKVDEAQAANVLAALPMAFVENQGQWLGTSRFVARHAGVTADLEPDSIGLRLDAEGSGTRNGTRLKLRFEGASADVRLDGEKRLGGIYNFFLGNDPGSWRTHVPGYARVRYPALHPGLDLVVHEGKKGLQYDLELAPGADLGRFVVRCEGVDSLAVIGDGKLVMKTKDGNLEQTAPVAWQTRTDGSRSRIDCCFRLVDDSCYGFSADAIDPELAMTVDPTIEYATYFGGNMFDTASKVAVDSTGNIYIAGMTFSTDLVPTATHGNTTRNPNKSVGFLAKLNPGAQNSLVFLSMFGGDDGEANFTLGMSLGCGPFLVSESAVYVCGWTGSGFPTKTLNPALSTYNGSQDGFLLCLDSVTGATMHYGVLLGGSGSDLVHAVTVDSSGNAHITGAKDKDATDQIGGDTNTRVYGPLGSKDAFSAVLDAAGNSVLASALVGGTSDDWPCAIAIDGMGNTYLAGWTRNDPVYPQGWFPTTWDTLKLIPPEGKKPSKKTDLDGFLVRLGATLSTLEYSTLLGGGGSDLVDEMAFASEQVYLTGYTESSDFPTANPASDPSIGLTGAVLSGDQDAFVTRLDFTNFVPGLVAPSLAFSSYLGADTGDAGGGIAVDSLGNIFVVGATEGPLRRKQKGFPTIGDQLKASAQDSRDGFLSIFQPAGNDYFLAYSTLIGGSSLDSPCDVALGSQDTSIHLLLRTRSTDLPTTSNAAFHSSAVSLYSAYLIKIR